MSKFDPYATLKIGRTASPDDIRAAYRELAARWHPDRNPGDEEAEARFKAITAAYECLNDPARRAHFDDTGDDSLAAAIVRADPNVGIIEPLTKALIAVMTQAPRDWETVSIVPALDACLRQMRGDVTARIEAMANQRPDLETILERLSVNTGENVLASVVRHQMRDTDLRIAKLRAERDQIDLAVAFVRTCNYRVEPPAFERDRVFDKWTIKDIQKAFTAITPLPWPPREEG